MSKQKTQPKYSPEARERAVRMIHEHAGEHASQWAAIVSLASLLAQPAPYTFAEQRRLFAQYE